KVKEILIVKRVRPKHKPCDLFVLGKQTVLPDELVSALVKCDPSEFISKKHCSWYKKSPDKFNCLKYYAFVYLAETVYIKYTEFAHEWFIWRIERGSKLLKKKRSK
ncbi:MAG: hypothetical protein HUJ52_03195, partial [Malacoplasma sp.]|nr:hypothetical protein [Malacoplasma sp.]